MIHTLINRIYRSHYGFLLKIRIVVIYCCINNFEIFYFWRWLVITLSVITILLIKRQTQLFSRYYQWMYVLPIIYSYTYSSMVLPRFDQFARGSASVGSRHKIVIVIMSSASAVDQRFRFPTSRIPVNIEHSRLSTAVRCSL